LSVPTGLTHGYSRGRLLIRHHLERHFLGSNGYYFPKPVWKLFATVTVLGPFFPPIVLFRPSFVRLGSSNIYGAVPSASTAHCRTFAIVFSNNGGSSDGGSNNC
jgi:hypothetical protein